MLRGATISWWDRRFRLSPPAVAGSAARWGRRSCRLPLTRSLPYTEDVKPSYIALLALVLTTACGERAPGPSFDSLTEGFVYGTLALSPASATQSGYHQHQHVNLDEALDDFSAQSIASQRQFYMDFRGRLEKWKAAGLSPEQRADFEIVSDQISMGLLELDSIQSYRHNPTVYVELIGNALFNPLVLEYTNKPQRIRHIIARLGKVPTLLEQAQRWPWTRTRAILT
jgi:uncharacterized protein (DUF885 family)